MNIRSVELTDAAALVPLLQQLDYPSDESAIRRRIERLLPDPQVGCWVAEYNDGLVGLLTGHLSWHIELDDPAARLTALVVDESARGLGVARQLVAIFEERARQHGAVKASLTSSDYRQNAHKAYEKLGWSITGKRFAKSLRPHRPIDGRSLFSVLGSAEVFRDEEVAYATALWAAGVHAELCEGGRPVCRHGLCRAVRFYPRGRRMRKGKGQASTERDRRFRPSYSAWK